MSTELREARAALCDLLLGRVFRARAETALLLALYAEKLGFEAAVDDMLDSAAHWERVAEFSERGLLCRVESE